MTRVVVAAIQMNSGPDPEKNWDRAQALAQRARERGARVIALPEDLLHDGDPDCRQDPAEWGPRFAELARACEATLVAGTIREPAGERAYNACFVYGPDGVQRAHYRKLHLFDVDVPGGPVERESDLILPGDQGPVVADLPPLGPTGVAICYDLRFPELFRALLDRGARTFVLPSSFALGTGKDHWLCLIRARAIENQCFVIAPNQTGVKRGNRARFGNSCVVDPWGKVLALASEAPEDVVVAELDFAAQARLRQALPCLDHRRLGG